MLIAEADRLSLKLKPFREAVASAARRRDASRHGTPEWHRADIEYQIAVKRLDHAIGGKMIWRNGKQYRISRLRSDANACIEAAYAAASTEEEREAAVAARSAPKRAPSVRQGMLSGHWRDRGTYTICLACGRSNAAAATGCDACGTPFEGAAQV